MIYQYTLNHCSETSGTINSTKHKITWRYLAGLLAGLPTIRFKRAIRQPNIEYAMNMGWANMLAWPHQTLDYPRYNVCILQPLMWSKKVQTPRWKNFTPVQHPVRWGNNSTHSAEWLATKMAHNSVPHGTHELPLLLLPSRKSAPNYESG